MRRPSRCKCCLQVPYCTGRGDYMSSVPRDRCSIALQDDNSTLEGMEVEVLKEMGAIIGLPSFGAAATSVSGVLHP